MPFILTGPQEKELDMINLYKQVAGGEPAVIANASLSQIDISAIQTGVPYIGNEINTEVMNTWQAIYQMLGISNMPFKTERQIEDEVQNLAEPAIIARLSSLNCRRRACDILNDRFGKYLTEPISVYWAQDNDSNNYNLLANLETQAKLDLLKPEEEGEDDRTNAAV